jgi:hypothetical protein
MNGTGQAAVAVKILRPSIRHREVETTLHMNDVPPRSRLYGLTPREMGTVWVESLTSYINRLGWRHGVSPRGLVVEEMLPHLHSKEWLRSSPGLVSIFSRRGGAMGLNGTQILAAEGSTLLEQLTMRSDLHLLTLQWWVGDLPLSRNLRKAPAWCGACYTQWREQGTPLYQPLLWMFQVVTWCPCHQRPLREQCPHCQRYQSVIATDKSDPGKCTQCGFWLGTQPGFATEPEVDDETIDWQHWVMQSLEELRAMSLLSGGFQWATFFTCFALGMKGKGAFSRLAQLIGIHRGILYRWIDGTAMPSLESILRICYVCKVTPCGVMSTQLDPLKQAMQRKAAMPSSRPRRPPHRPFNHEQCFEFLRRMLDGREEFLGITQIAKHLGCDVSLLLKYFPHACAVITQHMREYRKQQKDQRIAQACEEIRQAVIALHAQGIFPSHRKVRTLLSLPSFMRQPEASAAWHAARRELGLE